MKLTKLALFVFFLMASHMVRAQDFVTQWTFTTAATSLVFNAQTAGGAVNYTWSATPSGNSGSGSFTRTTAGSVTLSGLNIAAGDVVTIAMAPANLRRFYINDGADRLKLTNVTQWGAVPWTSMVAAFRGCSNLNISATDMPNLGGVSDMYQMFDGCTILNGPANIGSWNVGNVTSMASLFQEAVAFNQDISGWDVSNVTNMNSMFYVARAFNQDISGWDVSGVTNFAGMFSSADVFNQPIGTWNMSSATHTGFMFSSADMFNQDIGSWDVSNVTYMNSMFYDADAFNQDIGSWNTGNVTDMRLMFMDNDVFNQDISGWNTSKVTVMLSMFLRAVSFNQDISSWNVSSVTNANAMFIGATSFNQDLGNWVLNPAVTMTDMLSNNGMDCNNYSQTLIGWAANNPTITGRSLGATGRIYGNDGQTARNYLTGTQGWTISGDTYDPSCIVTLPVTFGEVAAFIKNARLEVNWTSISETNNSYYDIEVSADGKKFTKIGMVKSKAIDGNADETTAYSFISDLKPVAGVAAGLGILFLGGIGMGFSRRRKIVLIILSMATAWLFIVSCNKNEDALVHTDEELFVRIAQVDKDGSRSYSKVVEVIKVN